MNAITIAAIVVALAGTTRGSDEGGVSVETMKPAKVRADVAVRGTRAPLISEATSIH